MALNKTSAFVPSLVKCKTTASTQQNPSQSTCPRACCSRKSSGQIARRTLLQKSLLAAASIFLGTTPLSSADAAETADAKDAASERSCKNCYGKGMVTCELCSGTGFWRALQGNDPKQKYKGVVCPECEGTGTLTCPVCLGTGEGNIRGLLRRRRIEPGAGRVLQSN